MEQFLSSKLQAENLLLSMARLQEPICDLVPRENGVFAKQHLRRGTTFGPFVMNESTDKTNALDVSIAWEKTKDIVRTLDRDIGNSILILSHLCSKCDFGDKTSKNLRKFSLHSFS